ncbi:beta-phosphoglucomutase [Pseudoduganella flava]|uniref:Beta-phosphoglucomutase n=1 Tax=Pseudoduganella flava TaxID=871742 RepID=A0A562PPF3_9BURK|nr:beta-phosphoglucomutase [Pseudoduganella flava]QGZ40617.1 beta-phosphoglucomutase [Pseudoduganella flava]TWI46070.1 beta-phosphoglucomutase [Pseudoduganella flava]
MSRFAAVIFDLDGVITDTARYHYLAWKRLAESQGVHFDEAFNEHLKGIDRMGSLELILASATRRYSDAEKLALATEKNEHYKELIATMTPSDLLPGAVAALDDCRAAGLKIGLASVSRNAFTVLDRLGITGKFDYVVDAGTIAKGKPDPEIFLKAARELRVTPDACFGVEDAVAGVSSIKAAGMYAVGVGDPQVLAAADIVIPDLTQFRLEQYK